MCRHSPSRKDGVRLVELAPDVTEEEFRSKTEATNLLARWANKLAPMRVALVE